MFIYKSKSGKMSKLAVITGADGGMGKEITRAVAEAGYHVIMLCYTLFKGEERKNQMILETGNKEIEVRQVDLSSMASVINVADGLLGRGKHIDLLMNNAGTMSTHLMQTEDGLERTVAVNYVAPFLLTMRLLPLMGKGSRIVNMVSCTYSLGHITSDFFSRGKSGSFWRIPIYSNTKLALWLFTRELSERVKDSGITVNAADRSMLWSAATSAKVSRKALFVRESSRSLGTIVRICAEISLQCIRFGMKIRLFFQETPCWYWLIG